MRHVTMVTLVISIAALTMQCSKNESLNSLVGSTEAVSAGIEKGYFVGTDSSGTPDSVFMHTDSIIWVYLFPSGGPSSLSIIISGQSQADLEVETHTGGVVRLARDSAGVFTDTVPIAASPQSGMILTQSSWLFVKSGNQLLDTIRLVNPQVAYMGNNIPPPETADTSQKLELPKRRALSVIGK